MKILALETSSKTFSLAVADGEKILCSRNVVLDKVLSSSIIPNIQRVLRKAGWKLSDIDGIAVGLGPGSFTSLRVGLATVKGLAFAAQKPLVGIPSLDVLAMGAAGEPEETVCTLNDARRNLVYACFYANRGGCIERISDYLLTNIDDVLLRIKGKTLFVGDGAALYHDQLGKKKHCRIADKKFWSPQAKRMIPLALERFRKKAYDSLEQLNPLYLYPEDCQVQR